MLIIVIKYLQGVEAIMLKWKILKLLQRRLSGIILCQLLQS